MPVESALKELSKALIHANAADVGHLEDHKSIKLSTHAILFFGTPHQGLEDVWMRWLQGTVPGLSPVIERFLNNMKQNSEWLQQQWQLYAGIAGNFVVKFFYPTHVYGIGPVCLIVYSAVFTFHNSCRQILSPHLSFLRL
jgi:hypothetical protein